MGERGEEARVEEGGEEGGEEKRLVQCSQRTQHSTAHHKHNTTQSYIKPFKYVKPIKILHTLHWEDPINSLYIPSVHMKHVDTPGVPYLWCGNRL